MQAKIYADNGKLIEVIECERFSPYYGGLIELTGEGKKDGQRETLCQTNMTVIMESRAKAPDLQRLEKPFNVKIYNCNGRIMKEWANCNSLCYNDNINSFWTGDKWISVFGKIYIEIIRESE